MAKSPTRPTFNAEEELLIALCRQQGPQRKSGNIGFDVVILMVATGVFGFGLLSEQPAWMIAGFGVAVFRIIQWMRSSFRWSHVFNGIILKFDDAFRESTENGTDK